MTAKAFIEGVVAAKDPKCPLASALRLYIAHYFRSSAPRYGLVDPASRLAFRIERPRRSRKGSKKTEATVEIKPPVQDGINNPVVVRQDSNVQVISGKFLGDFQRHYDEKGYKIFDWVLETNPLAYFTALVGLSKIVRVEADITHREGSKPKGLDEILERVEEQTGKEGRAAFVSVDPLQLCYPIIGIYGNGSIVRIRGRRMRQIKAHAFTLNLRLEWQTS